ncbi:MAG: ZIP family metal transporter [Acidobacteriota bacterium]|nr:ZIP family metal transporter [Acidobacteriota bacterium]
MPPSILMPVVAAAIAVACARLAMELAQGRRARVLIPLSGGLLAGVAVFGLIPEIAHESGWPITLALAATGYGALALLDRSGFPVCPGCSHGQEFARTLVAATAVHAFIDGWGMVAAGNRGVVSAAIVSAMLLHKIPEGLALGAMLRVSAAGSPLGMAVLAEAPTVAGGVVGLWATLGTTSRGDWVNYPLALVAGSFLFLGLHAILPQGFRLRWRR